MKQLQSLKWKNGMQLSNLFERFNDLIELCSFDKPQHQMTFFHEMFSECNIKRYQDELLNQTNLNQNLDDLKARLLSEEAIVRLNDPDMRPTKKFKVNNVSSSSSDIPNKEKVIKEAHNLVKSAMSNKSKK